MVPKIKMINKIIVFIGFIQILNNTNKTFPHFPEDFLKLNFIIIYRKMFNQNGPTKVDCLIVNDEKQKERKYVHFPLKLYCQTIISVR